MAAFSFIWAGLLLFRHVVFTLDSCSSKLKCEDCIRDSSLCVWCAANNFNGTRCRAENSNIEDNWCPAIIEHSNNFIRIIKNQGFGHDSKNVVQIKPQEYKIKLRPGKLEKFEFSFQGAQDFPVDLYFLMDASISMSKIREQTAKESEHIYMTMKNITKNVYLGFGTFIDKRAFPFISTFNNEETYSFRHRLPLTDNFTEFEQIISKTPDGKNRDVQEGGLDALAQVMVCTNITGWRKESRKIIIFLTDGYYHAAGDGRSAGIFEPYDGGCHTVNGSYTKELEMDYPSIGMINKLAIERNMIVLFFVENEVKGVYSELSKVISRSRLSTFIRHTKASTTHESIAQTLKDIYEKISSKVTLKNNIKSRHRQNLEINFKPNCVSDDSGHECDVEIGKEKKFFGTIKVLEYDGYDNMVVDIAVESIEERLRLDIEVINNCNCTSIGVEKNSSYCNGEKRVCGECDCGDQRYGERCICEKTGDKVFNDNSTCIMKDSNEICNGRGLCVCGTCRCRTGYDGKFCQCDHLSCPLSDGKLCSGEERGKCVCGKCKCEPGWEPPSCKCPKVDCKVDGVACNGRGECICGACVCDPLPLWDKRTLQLDNCNVTASLDSHNLQCKVLDACAMCQRKRQNNDCNSCEHKVETLVVPTLTGEYLDSKLWNLCPDIKVDLGCYSKFVYRYNDTKYSLELVVEQEKNCAETHYLFGGIFLLVFIVIGVATLVAWKLLTDARDRREYKQFLEKTNLERKITTNPLYIPALKTFQNPRRRKSSYIF